MGQVRSGRSHWVPAPQEHELLRDLTVGGLLDEAAAEVPDREAVVYSAYADRGIDLRWTYRELRERARRVARALIAGGVRAGDRVAVWATNRPEWLEVQFGVAYAGAVLVPLNPLYRRHELEYVLGKSGASVCVSLTENRGVLLWEILQEVAPGLPGLTTTVGIGPVPDGGLGWDAWLASGDAVGDGELDTRVASVMPTDTSQVQFTSGTTGFPKGAELSHRGIVNNGRLFARKAGLVPGRGHVNPMPYFHCGGCVMSTLGTIAVRGTQMPIVTFEADRVVRTIDVERATSVSLVPTMMIAIEESIAEHGGDLRSLEVVVTGGSPVPVEVEQRWVDRFGTGFAITYGMTEASPVITMTAPDDPLKLQIETCGRPLPGLEVVVAGVDDEPVPLGDAGEVRVRGWSVMHGYWDDADATAAATDRHGFLRSGDIGRMDEDGYVSITGRAKEMIIRGGENLSPAEIENVLRGLDEVVDAAVVGVPSERYGEEVAAFVRVADGATLTRERMVDLLTPRIARYKIPRHLRVVDAFPLTPSGKVQKFRLRESFADHEEAAG